jgi:hypothetical protein
MVTTGAIPVSPSLSRYLARGLGYRPVYAWHPDVLAAGQCPANR